MTPSKIRIELEQLSSSCSNTDIIRLSRAWSAVRGDTPYRATVDQMLSELADINTPFPIDEGIGFEIYSIENLWHWESCGPVYADDYCSEDGFSCVIDCVVDAIAWLDNVLEMEEEGQRIDNASESRPIIIELPENSPYQLGIHFALYQNVGEAGIRWHGLCQERGESSQWWGEGDFSHLKSDKDYFNAYIAAADCVFALHIDRGHRLEKAADLVSNLGLPVFTVIQEIEQPITEHLRQLQVTELNRLWDQIPPLVQKEIETTIQVLEEDKRDQSRYGMALVTTMPAKGGDSQ
ncbi:hypothetical protein [cf. Phormidesmis sp. LEGE 11477]|uniref:hypothetical protein n=1 Tax=cf. Phormidesmis sp. LEGE 11477 TaxID=1828680 RepID=UPI001880A5DB|nr:hypothetical protein [cf. Phormidesmis sp. LEGE 11477]MBE9064268.1 hypothetical protein [cf. Phormidesmis sp. LEGE 11477]